MHVCLRAWAWACLQQGGWEGGGDPLSGALDGSAKLFTHGRLITAVVYMQAS